MNSKTVSVVSALTLIGILVAAAFCYREHVTLDASRAQVLGSELQPIATLLKKTKLLSRNLGPNPLPKKTPAS
jgi:hypothetical protein